MMARVRHFKSKIIYCLNDEQFLYNKNFNFWTFKETENLRSPFNVRQSASKNKMFDTNYIFYHTEVLNKSIRLFINYFTSLSKEKGFQVEFIEDEKVNTRKQNLKFMEIYEIDEAILYEKTGTKFIQAKIDKLQEPEHVEERDHLIDCLEDEKQKAFTENKKKNSEKIKKDMATEDDKTMNTKMFYLDLLGYDSIDDDNIETVKIFYKNVHLMNNYLAHINPENLDKKLLKNLFDDSLINIQTRQKHDIGKTALNVLGFLDIWDQRVLSKAEFEQNLATLLAHEKLKDLKTIACLYGLDKRTADNIKKDPTTKAKLAFINTLLSNACLTIKRVQRTVNKKSCSYYKMEHINDIKEIIKNKHSKGHNIGIPEERLNFYIQ